MRHALALALTMLLVATPSAAQVQSAPPAQNVSADDLVKLSAAGLSDDILIALIESNRAVFRLNAEDVLSLRSRGLSERVILAMLQTARTTSTTAPASAPVVVEPVAATPLPDVDRTVTVVQSTAAPPDASPLVVNVTQQVDQQVETPADRAYPYPYPSAAFVTYPVAVPVYLPVRRPHAPEKKAEPVYWGFDGKRRPDTWKKK